MNVRELVNILSKYDSELPVLIETFDGALDIEEATTYFRLGSKDVEVSSIVLTPVEPSYD